MARRLAVGALIMVRSAVSQAEVLILVLNGKSLRNSKAMVIELKRQYAFNQ